MRLTNSARQEAGLFQNIQTVPLCWNGAESLLAVAAGSRAHLTASPAMVTGAVSEREPFGGSISASVHFGGSNSACVHFGGSCLLKGSRSMRYREFGVSSLSDLSGIMTPGMYTARPYKKVAIH